MKLNSFTLFFLTLFSFSLCAQNMEDYTSSWKGQIQDAETFSFTIEIKDLRSDNPVFIISNKNEILNKSFKLSDDNLITISLDDNLTFQGILSDTGSEINGFIKSGLLLYHVTLTKTKSKSFVGFWNILMVDELLSQHFYLSLENGSGDDYEAYPIFGDNRFTGTWCGNFKKEKDLISFSDMKTGLNFKGTLKTEEIELGIYLGNHLITKIDLEQYDLDWEIGGFGSKDFHGEPSNADLIEMENNILNDSLPNTHSVLISKKGKTIYANNFDGYSCCIPHDIRSASKSISSAIVGIALDQGLFENVEQSIYDFLPEEYQSSKDSFKAKIDIQSLLTMSSGLDAIDFGVERDSKASEDNYQNSADWTKTILNAPMINKPNSHSNYASANPHLLGVAMDSVVPESLELFMDKNLFQKLGISNYIIQTDEKGKPYFGGGMYLTPNDMLKFGQLYLQNGKWKKEQVISEKWVESSVENYRVLENTMDKNGYGYLWWRHKYQVNGTVIESIEARGSGGQYIFILPSLDAVVVITSGNFRNGKFQQPELILEKYILPYLEE